jgi:BirA family transcriptional regulator, biotin operon repressor / biotin---[acetyl-CoA-carboxylase] ligase
MTAPLYHFDRVDSTMDVVHALAAEGAPAGLAVVAMEQLGGRGSRGRPWHSPPGGLWLSMLFRPPAGEGIEVISLRVGIAVAEALDPLLNDRLRIKWPNDLMLGARKAGGILCEARWQGDALGWVAAGVGLNVRNSIPEELADVAVALGSDYPDLELEQVEERTLCGLRALDLGSERLTSDELGRFAGRDWLRGRELRSPVRGVAAGVGDDGSLRVAGREGVTVVRRGTVELAPVASHR